MKFLINLLLSITIGLIIASYFGNYGLEIGHRNIVTAYIMGCGIGKAEQKRFASPLDAREIAGCYVAGKRFKEALEAGTRN
jgi:hypothetical protein